MLYGLERKNKLARCKYRATIINLCFDLGNKHEMTYDEFTVVYVDRKYGNAYYDRYRNNWIECAIEHEEGKALHLDRKSGALVCYGYGHENNHIGGRRYKIVEIDVDE